MAVQASCLAWPRQAFSVTAAGKIIMPGQFSPAGRFQRCEEADLAGSLESFAHQHGLMENHLDKSHAQLEGTLESSRLFQIG